MPLPILALLVVAGITAIVVIVHFTGGSAEARPLDRETVMARFAEDFPHFGACECVLSDDGQAAVLFSRDDREAGLVSRIGRNSLTRLLDADLLDEPGVGEDVLELRLHDFTLPLVKLRLATPGEAKRVANRLTSILGDASDA